MNAATDINTPNTPPNLYGHVCDYQTGEAIRPATREDWLTGRRLGEPHTGAHRTDEFGVRTIYVDGPESDPDADAVLKRVPLSYYHEKYSGHSNQATAWDIICTAAAAGWTFFLGDTEVDRDDAIAFASGDPRVLEWDLPSGALSLRPPPDLEIKVAADLMRSRACTDDDMRAADQFERVGNRIFG